MTNTRLKISVSDAERLIYAADLDNKAILVTTVDRHKDIRRGKVKHFSAAQRAAKWAGFWEWAAYLSMTALVVVLTLKTFGKFDSIPLWLALILSGVTAGAQMVDLRFSFRNNARTHRDIGNKYVALALEIEALVARLLDHDISSDAFSEACDRVNKSYMDINKQAESAPTSSDDLKQALAAEQKSSLKIPALAMLLEERFAENPVSMADALLDPSSGS